jgi:hypothetical protein
MLLWKMLIYMQFWYYNKRVFRDYIRNFFWLKNWCNYRFK